MASIKLHNKPYNNYSVCLVLFFLPSVFGSFTGMVNLGGNGPNVVKEAIYFFFCFLEKCKDISNCGKGK